MNVLPFVIVFLTIIALTWSSLMQSTLSTSISTEGFIAHQRALNKAYDQLEKQFFKSDSPKDKPKTSFPPSREGKIYTSPRHQTKTESSKLLFSTKLPPKGREVLKDLLISLYGRESYFHKELPDQIIDALLLHMKDPDFEPTSLCFTDDCLQSAWYQMLKDGATPPLTDYVAFLPESEHLLYPRFTSVTLLTIYFGQDATYDLLKREEAKYYAEPGKPSLLDEKELKEWLSHHNLSNEMAYLNFSHTPRVKRLLQGQYGDIAVSLAVEAASTALDSGQEDVESCSDPDI